MMPVSIHPIRPDVLPQVTRFVVVAGVTFTVHIRTEGGKRLAWHDATGCWGYAATVDDALRDIALMLANEYEWYCSGEGARMYLDGRMFERRAAIQAAFNAGGY